MNPGEKLIGQEAAGRCEEPPGPRRRKRGRRPHPGAAPGTLVVPHDAPRPRIRVMDFCPERVEEKELSSPEEVIPYLTDATPSITWVDVQGLGDRRVLEDLGRIFSLHPLTLADVVNIPQRPKVEAFEKHLFMITRMSLLRPSGEIENEQVSLFLGKGFVLTFQETYGDCLDPVRDRIRQDLGMVRKSGADYLFYAILDAIIDQYFPVVESLGERIERLEDDVVQRPAPAILERIYTQKRDLLSVRRGIWPQRDALNTLVRDESSLLGKETRVYLRDCYDHAAQLIDIVETHRDLTASLLEVYLSSIANRTNEVMRFLTVVTSIFIPLTFLVGVYGMNFDTSQPLNMPELTWRYGYLACWAFMIAVAACLLVFFARKGWLRTNAMPAPPRGKGRERSRAST
jgi:magnesium transporter